MVENIKLGHEINEDEIVSKVLQKLPLFNNTSVNSVKHCQMIPKGMIKRITKLREVKNDKDIWIF
jgi:hypothetical protein